MFKVKNKDTRATYWRIVCIVNSELISDLVLAFVLLIFNMQLPVEIDCCPKDS